MTTSGKRTSSREKAANLERIRNNQRRCRARQKEHIAKLEDRIRRFETDNFDSTINQKLEQLVTENESLKRLLQSLGLHDDFLIAYGSATRIAPNISKATLCSESSSQAKLCSSPAQSLSILQTHLTQSSDCEPRAQCILSLPGPDVADSKRGPQDSNMMDEPLPWELPEFFTDSICALELSQMDVQAESFNHLTVESLIGQACGNVLTTEMVSDTTSLCSWAFSLVLKNNPKGYSAVDLDLKLRVGYRHGATATEGCRIDNKTLLNVIAEIL